MIQFRKFSEKSKNAIIVGASSIILIFIMPEMLLLSLKSTIGFPISFLLTPRHSLISRGIIYSLFHIRMILRMGTWAKIFSCIVESITIFMIYMWRRISDYEMMQKNLLSGSIWKDSPSDSIISVNGLPVCSAPVEFHSSIIFTGIDNSDLSFCERNVFDRLILRLNNRIACNAILGHESTSNGFAVFDRFFIVPKMRVI